MEPESSSSPAEDALAAGAGTVNAAPDIEGSKTGLKQVYGKNYNAIIQILRDDHRSFDNAYGRNDFSNRVVFSHNKGMDPDQVPPGCFEFRLRTRSFDLHQLTHGSKLKKFGRLFRASSDGGEKQTSSVPSSPAATSPRHSPPRRRRFVRVVRDKPEDCTEDGRYVVHKYSEAFLERMNRERHASESEYGDRPLPYEVTGHTILKKTALSHSQSINSNNSITGDGESTPPVFKRASFRDEVVVIEFDTKRKVREAPATHVVPLHDAIIDDYDSHAACQRFEDFAMNETIAALTKGLLSTDDADESEAVQPAEPSAAETNGVADEPDSAASDEQ